MAKEGLSGRGGWFDRTIVGPRLSLSQEYTSGTVNLTEDLARKEISVLAGATIKTYDELNRRCRKIICSGTMTVAGTISCDGGIPWSSSGGSPGFSIGGLLTPQGTVGGSGSGGDSGATGANATVGTQQAKRWLGGSGGDGGTSDSGVGNGGGGADISLIQAPVSGNPSVFQNAVTFTESYIGENSLDNIVLPFKVCGGGGGGGGGGNAGVGTGGGGCGGGVVWIAADRLVIDGGIITANGQSINATGYGGGGGGGAVIIVCSELDFRSGEIRAAGGTGGLGGAGDGSDGKVFILAAGHFLQFPTPDLTSLNSATVTPAIYKQAVALYHQKGRINWSTGI